MTSRRMRRRYLLKASGIVGLTGVAGISGWAFLSGPDQADESSAEDTPSRSKTAGTTHATATDSRSAKQDTPSQQSSQAAEPAFQIENIQAPSEVELGTEFTVRIEIKNSGLVDGRFTSTLSITEDDIYAAEESVALDIPAGETRTWEYTSSVSYVTTREYELESGQDSWSIDITKRTEPLGTPVTPDGRQITVDKLVAKGAAFEGPYGRPTTAAEGNKFVFAHVTATNTGEESALLPMPADFSLLADQDQYRDSQFEPSVYTAQPEYQGGSVQPGIQRSGIVVFETPADIQIENFRVLWREVGVEGDTVVEWVDS